MNDRDFDAIVAGFYEAASGAIGWLEALVPFQRALSAQTVHLHAVDLAAGRIAFSHAATDTPPEAELDYVRTYYRIDPRTELVLGLQPGEWFNCWESFDEAFVARDPFYQDFLIPYGGRYVSGTKVLQDGSLNVFLGIHRGYGSSVLTGEEMALCSRLARHMTEALKLHRKMIDQRQQNRLGTTLLSRLRAPVVLLDEQRQLRHANPSAQALLPGTDAVFERNGLLYCQRPEDDNAFLLALRDLLRDRQAVLDGSTEKPMFLRVRSSSAAAPLGLYLHALQPADTLHAFGDEPLAMMLIHDRQARVAVDPFVVANAFGLTPAEARVAVAMMEGGSAQSIAGDHHTSIHTVRSQLESIMQKTGTTRQAEMVSLLVGLPMTALK